VAACQGGRLVVHFTNRKNAPFFFFHMNGDATIFRDEQLLFCLEEDFKNDGRSDVAIAGLFDNPFNASDRTFVAILTRTGKSWKRIFLLRPRARLIVLHMLDAQNDVTPKGSRGFVARFTIAPSEDYAAIYWDGQGYKYVSGFDLIHRSIEDAMKDLRR